MKKFLFLLALYACISTGWAQQHLQTVSGTGGSISSNAGFQSISVVGEPAVGSFSASGYSGTFGYLNSEDQLFTGVSEKRAAENRILVFPNPNEGSFRVSTPFADGEIEEILVLNVLGQCIFSLKNPSSTDLNIELGTIPPGAYRLLFRAENVLYQKELMVR